MNKLTPSHHLRYLLLYITGCLFFFIAFSSCHTATKPPKQKDIVKDIKQIDERIADDITENINFIAESKRPLIGPDFLYKPSALVLFYKKNGEKSHWSANGKWYPVGDSVLSILSAADDYGLNPDDYYVKNLKGLISQTNTKSKNDAAVWAKADLLLTDALIKLINQVHFGTSTSDTVTGRKVFSFTDSVLVSIANTISDKKVKGIINQLEPHYQQYHDLKSALQTFRADYDSVVWDTVSSLHKNTPLFNKELKIRLSESVDYDSTLYLKDSLKLVAALKKFQLSHGLFPDGKAGDRTIKALNVSVAQRVKQIMLNMNHWRSEQDSLPHKYIIVNIPSFAMELWDDDTVRISSKVIIGKPATPTPLLSSSIHYYIIYPYWTVPLSIIINDLLPKLQKDTSYLRKNNMDVMDWHGNIIDPKTIKWKKLNKNYFPYKIRQREGDDNTLGIVKFNFPGKFGIYMHDTKERSLFSKDFRGLSHGCIRLQQALPLAYYLVKDDSIKYPVDSLRNWFNNKQKKQVNLQQPIPIYVRYNTCEVKNGELIFYDDLYSWEE